MADGTRNGGRGAVGTYRLSVPCSTSNLGPGFDQLGLCLALHLTVTARPREAAGDAVVAEPGLDWPALADDLLWRAFELAAGERAREATLAVRSAIPIGRGLGSTGAAVAAGLLLGRAWVGGATDDAGRRELLPLGIRLEGHPDNVAAALFGGCTLCVPIDDESPPVVRVDVHPTLGFAVAWPAAPLATARARAALPRAVPFADAVENARRLPLLLEGLRSGDPDLVRLGSHDRLHERYRLPLLPGATAALAAAREAGAFAATVSGAGSALIAIGPLAARERLASALAGPLRDATGAAEGHALDVVRDAPTVERC